MKMHEKLSKDTEKHIKKQLKKIDLESITKAIGDPCEGCPGRDKECYLCPIWSLRLDLTELRLRRRLERL